MPTSKLTNTIIDAAIAGFEFQKTQLDAQIAELRALQTGSATANEPAPPPAAAKKRSRFSRVIRKRMAEAQKKRWAGIKGKAGGGAAHSAAPKKAPQAKRRISPEGRKRIIEATKKMWAAKRAAAAAENAGKPAVKKAPPKKSA